MVERDLAMVDVASSTLVSRSICFLILFISVARMAELVDARDLKSLGIFLPCRFKSGSGHHKV